MGKDTKEVVKDPNEGLADDAVLATDLGDEDARTNEQLAYYGGDTDDDTDDLSELDRGDVVGEEKDDVSEGESEEESEEEKEGEGDDPEEGSDDDESDDDAKDESADDGDQEDSESDEDESEDDESADDVEDEDPKPKDKGIPRHRFNEVNTRMRDAEAKLARIDAEKAAETAATEDAFDFDTAEEEYMGLLLDGKTKEAGAKRREIRAAEKEDFKAEAVAESTSSVSQQQTKEALDSLTKEAEKMFPIFDQRSDDFNPEAVSKTLTFMRGYQSEGLKADDAFVAALADMMEMFDLVTESGDTESQSDDGDEKPVKKVTKKEPIKKTKQKIKAAKQQGKTVVGEGDASADAGAVVPDIDQMSDEELDALPEATIARMRGDII